MENANPRPKLSIHSGNGNLRGGGVRPAGTGTFLRLAPKLERRLDPVFFLCLATMASVLTINGLFHETTRGAMVDMIEAIEREILLIQQHELAQLAGIETTMATMGEEGKEVMMEGNSSLVVVDGSVDKAVDGSENGGMGAVKTLIRRRADQLAELELFRDGFAETELTLWTLVILSILGLLLTALSMFAMRVNGKNARIWRMAHKVTFLLIALLFLVQFFLLLLSLLPNSIALPSMIDRLFSTYLAELSAERMNSLVAPIEDGFACKMKIDHELLERMGLQEQCVPKIKDRLLAPYIVLFLILVALFPLFFGAFAVLWALRLKEWDPIRDARKRIEMSQGERRPQSREEILARALATKTSREERMNEKMYY